MPEEPVKLFETLLGLQLGIMLGIITAIILLSWLLNIVSLMLGAKIAGIKDRGFGKALLATVLIVFLGGLVATLLTALHPLAGLIGVFIIPCLFIQWVYSCPFSKACLAYILSFIANIIFFVAIMITLPLAFNMYADKINKSNSTDKAKIEATDQNSHKTDVPASKNASPEN